MKWGVAAAAGRGQRRARRAAGGDGAYAVRMAGEARGVVDEDKRLVEKVERICQHVATENTHEGPAHASHGVVREWHCVDHASTRQASAASWRTMSMRRGVLRQASCTNDACRGRASRTRRALAAT